MRIVLTAALTLFACNVGTQTPRYLNFEPGKPIKSRLTRHDSHVVIEKNLPPLFFAVPGELPAKEILEGYTLHSAAVLLVRLTAKEIRLTEQRDWIVTRFRGQILEQFKPKPVTLKVDDFLLEVNGGTITIDGTRVEASAFWEPEFAVGRTYLVFPESRQWPAHNVVAYEIGADGRLKNISPEFDPNSDIDNLDRLQLSEAKKIIRAAPPRGRP